MTNLQLLLSIGVPSLVIILSMMVNNRRMDGIEKRLDRLEVRLDRMASRIEEIIAANHRDALEIMRAMTSLYERLAVVEARQTP